MTTGIVTASIGLNVRKSPDANSKKVTSLANNTQVTVLGEKNGWYQIDYSGCQGYVCGKYLSVKGDTKSETKSGSSNNSGSSSSSGKVYKTTANLNVRTGPGVNYGTKGVLQSGEKIVATGEEGNWLKITYKGSVGYCSKKYTTANVNGGNSGSAQNEEKSANNTTSKKDEKQAAYTPGGNMTNQYCKGLPLSKYHVGVSETSANNERWRLHPTLQSKLAQLDALIAKEGIPFSLFEGMRSPVRQQYCKDHGTSSLGAWYGNHNYGLAADYVDNKRTWNTKKYDYNKLGKLGKSLGLVWGGDWKSPYDPPHFQLASAPKASECKKLYEKGGIDAVWAKV